MLGVAVATALALALAGALYLGIERLGAAGWGMALLRAAGVFALTLLLFHPARLGPAPAGPPTVLLDASLSMQAAGGRWQQARDTARVLAGREGVVIRFGARVAPGDSGPPADAGSRLGDALRLAHGRPGPVIVVTDGEIEDAATLEPGLLARTRVVLVPREPVPDAALLGMAAPDRLAPDDSLRLDLLIGTAGSLTAPRSRLEVDLDGKSVVRRELDLPPAPGTARRRVVLSSRGWAVGLHLLTVRLRAEGDAEPRDDVRQHWVEAAAQPGIVVLAAPAGWEARFLVKELLEIQPGSVRGFALIQAGRWVDVQTFDPVAAMSVHEAARTAAVVVTLGSGLSRMTGGRALWQWLSADSALSSTAGDWYVGGPPPPSPLAAALGGVTWDSVPPLVGLVPVAPGQSEWVALAARLGRRGAARPIVVGRDSAGRRAVAVAGEGFWRWALRGGAAREAYRSLLAGTLDWLLAPTPRREVALGVAARVVERGRPIVFRFEGTPVPDSLGVRLDDGHTTRELTLRFDAEREAQVWLEPGVYRWQAVPERLGRGRVAVEEYSGEFPPRGVTLKAGGGQGSEGGGMVLPRSRPWLFALVIAALAGEWMWRHRRGLP